MPRPQPPVWDVFDVEVDVDHGGNVVARLGVDPRLCAGRGLAGPGLVAMLADCVLGTDAALRGRSRIATAVLTVDFVGHPPESGSLHAVSGDHAVRGGYLLTTAGIRDPAGAAVARASGWFVVRNGSSVPPRTAAGGTGPEPALPGAARPVGPAPAAGRRGNALASTGSDPTTGTLGRTLGLTSFTGGPDRSLSFDLPDVGRLTNSGGTLHGGVAALLASVAALSTLGDGARPEVLSMTCHYLRAAGTDGGPVRVTGRQIRSGRTSAVVQGDVYAPDGSPAMHTVLTAALTS